MKYDVIIAGSGLGGLLCGYILAKEGLSVCILEKNQQAGGCLQTFTRKDVVFDTGVHYFGGMDPGQTLNRYWNYFGLTRSLKLERMDPDGFDVIGINGKDYPLAMGFDRFIDKLHSFFNSEKETIEKYICRLKEISRHSRSIILKCRQTIRKIITAIRVPVIFIPHFPGTGHLHQYWQGTIFYMQEAENVPPFTYLP